MKENETTEFQSRQTGHGFSVMMKVDDPSRSGGKLRKKRKHEKIR